MNTRALKYGWAVLGVILLFLVPAMTSSGYYLQLAAQLLIFSILFIGLDIAVGHAGLASVAHGALFGVGAYTTAILATKAGWAFWPTVPVAIVIAAVLGLIVGALTLRLEGHYFVIATLAFSLLVAIVLQNWTSLTNGELGVSPIPAPGPILGIEFRSAQNFYLLLVVITVLVALLTHLLTKSGTGQRLRAIRDNTPLASSVGVDASRTRLVAFVISAGIGGLAGSLQASNLSYIDPSLASFEVGFTALMAVIIGGRAKIAGPFLGAAIFVILPEILRAADELRLILLGVLLLLVVLFAPDGIAGRIGAAYHWVRQRFRRHDNEDEVTGPVVSPPTPLTTETTPAVREEGAVR